MSRPSSPSSNPHSVHAPSNNSDGPFTDYTATSNSLYPHGGLIYQPTSNRSSVSWGLSNGAENFPYGSNRPRGSIEDLSPFPPLTSEELTAHSQTGSFSGPSGIVPYPHHNSIGLPLQGHHGHVYDPRMGPAYYMNSPLDVQQGNINTPSETSSGRPSTSSSSAPDPNSIDSETITSEGPRTSTGPLSRIFNLQPSYPYRSSFQGEYVGPNATTLSPTALLPPSTGPGLNGAPYGFYAPPSLPTRIDQGEDPNSSQSYSMSPTDSPLVEEEDDEYEDGDIELAKPHRRYVSSTRSGGNSRLVPCPNDRQKGTGRRKIEIKKIEYKLKRQITFSKRKTGLLKKVRELTTLTNTQALVILVSETGNPHTFATEDFVKMIRDHDFAKLNQYLDSEDTKRKNKS